MISGWPEEERRVAVCLHHKYVPRSEVHSGQVVHFAFVPFLNCNDGGFVRLPEIDLLKILAAQSRLILTRHGTTEPPWGFAAPTPPLFTSSD